MTDSKVPLRAAPLLGQDNPQVYGELLGRTAEEPKPAPIRAPLAPEPAIQLGLF